MFDKYQNLLLQVNNIDLAFIYENQEHIFYHLLGYFPHVGKMYYSPFREDRHPGCRYIYDKGILYLIENTRFKSKLRWSCIDCLIELNNLTYKQALNYANKLLLKTFKPRSTTKRVYIPKMNLRPDIRFKWVKWDDNNNYFSKFGVSSDYMNKQPYYCTTEYWCSTRTDSILRKNRFGNKYCIAYLFKSGNVKLYFPDEEFRFYSNCKNSDLFGTHRTYDDKSAILITKSAKDELVFNYHTGMPTIALQQETLSRYEHMKESMKDVLAFIKDYKQIYIWFDADRTGITESKKLCLFLSNQGFICKNIIHDEKLGNDIAQLQLNNNLIKVWQSKK